jgi:alkylhydroperoxidase family enzyme
MSLRLAVAKQHGFDETTADKVDHYESSDLSERHKVALRVADAMMSQPGSISPTLRSEVHEHFTDQEILELTLDVMKWNYQNVPVALGIDAEVTPGQLTDLHFDRDGRPEVASER